MMITINGNSHVLKQELSLSELFRLHAIKDLKGVAVAVNERVITRSGWEEHVVKDGDKVLIIKATQGG